MTVRLLKAALVGSVGLWALLVAWGNVADPGANWQFVQHVLAMDTVFADNPLKSRAITDPALQRIAYGLIIATEWVVSGLCLAGAWRLWRCRRDPPAFIKAKALAACGLVVAFVLYFVGFVAIGGEWFCMWQSPVWNGQAKAIGFLTVALLVLGVLLVPEDLSALSPQAPIALEQSSTIVDPGAAGPSKIRR